MDFEEAKNLLKEAIDEAETQGDILRIWIEKVYQQGKHDERQEIEQIYSMFGDAIKNIKVTYEVQHG